MHEELAKEIFQDFLDNLEICSEKGISKDGETLAKLIFLKYGGEDMVDVLKCIFQHVYARNHFVSDTISVKK